MGCYDGTSTLLGMVPHRSCSLPGRLHRCTHGIRFNTVTYRRGMGDPSPPLQILRWYRELGGEILTFGSDAHIAGAIASHFDVALEMARAAGFTRVATFEQRRIHWMRI